MIECHLNARVDDACGHLEVELVVALARKCQHVADQPAEALAFRKDHAQMPGGKPGLALFTLGALIFLLAAIQAIFDPRLVWERVAWASDEARRTAEHPIARTTS